MISRLGPFVQSGKRSLIVGLHLSGGVVGGAATGLLLGLAGAVAFEVLHFSDRMGFIVVLVALAYGGAADIGRELPRVRFNRQTPGLWPCTLGDYPAAFFWGADLGTCVTTRPPQQLALAVPIAALATGDVIVGIIVMTVFGASRAAVTLLVVGHSKTAFAVVCDAINARERLISRTVAAASLAVATAVLLVGIG